ncbi:7-cyano-7-deazaguanine synthase QueC [Chlamydiia bacterium]|jgi:7-cyano-7-deazaguanine synthase|nr:7-cyano-7-deazaguanine synthase QueC [Chlamydiia bacterium]
MNTNDALVVFSGGVDSAVCLSIAKEKHPRVVALSFDYGQTHDIELEYAVSYCKNLSIEHIIHKINFDNIASPLNKAEKKLTRTENVSKMYVPGRNTCFISFAAAFAESMNIPTIYIGPNKDDYAFPDCSIVFVEAWNNLLNTQTHLKPQLKILAPLITLKKADIFKLAYQYNIAIDKTWSCYYPQGKTPCQLCDACLIRKKATKTI